MPALPFPSHVILDKTRSSQSLSFLSIKCLSHRVWGKGCNWKCFANYKALCQHLLSQQVFTEGLLCARHCSSLTAAIIPSAAPLQLITGCQLQTQPSLWSPDAHLFTQLFLIEALVTCLHQEILNDISAPAALGDLSPGTC